MRSFRFASLIPWFVPLLSIQCSSGGGLPEDPSKKPMEPVLNLNLRPPERSILLNQLAYHPEERKEIVILNPAGTECLLSGPDSELIGRFPIEPLPSHPDYDVSLARCDLSSVKQEGSFALQIGEFTQELSLHIQTARLAPLLLAAQKTYYYQRASSPLEARYAGTWARAAGHPDVQLTVRKTVDGSDGKIRDVPGGWYDAGDYGKYMVNAGITVGTLLLAWEDFPEILQHKLNIPKSAKNLPDHLEEIRYELDWFLTMQDEDGGVFFKVGPLSWPGFILPHEDHGKRYITGKSTASTLNFAAACAQASRHFASFDPPYAERLLNAAERAWHWALKHPKILAPRLDSTGGTGGYEDEDMRDEFLWAAVELARVKQNYRSEAEGRLLAMSAQPKVGEALWWSNLHGLAFMSAFRDRSWSPKVRAHIQNELLAYADGIQRRAADNPFKIAYSGQDFIWGSNGGLANQGMILLNAYALTGEESYRQSARDILHYLLGRNIHGLSFITGFGTQSAAAPHHRPSGGDKIEAVIPGFLVGGPNAARNDQALVAYPKNRQGPYCYVDVQESYASNEVAINWNAPLVYLLAGLEAKTKP